MLTLRSGEQNKLRKQEKQKERATRGKTNARKTERARANGREAGKTGLNRQALLRTKEKKRREQEGERETANQ